MIYRTIYKCRLCGNLFIHEEYEVLEEMKTSEEKFPFYVRNIIRHDCENGDCGVADIQGFRKVDD